MENDGGFLDRLREVVRRKKDDAWVRLFDSAALYGASSCLADAREITDPVEQVKYLFNRFEDKEAHFRNIPWAWLTHCIEKGTITKMPIEEDWTTCLFIHRARFVGGTELVLQFLSKL